MRGLPPCQGDRWHAEDEWDWQKELDLDEPANTQDCPTEQRPSKPAAGFVERANEGPDRERKQPEDEIPGIERVRLLPAREEAVHPKPIRAEIEPATERRQDRGQDRDVRPTGQPAGEQIGRQRQDGQPGQAQDHRYGGHVQPAEARPGREQQVEAGRIVGR